MSLGKVYWYAPEGAEEDWYEYELEVTICNLIDGKIYIIAEADIDGEHYEAKLYLYAKNGEQKTTGTWLSGTVRRAIPCFSEKAEASDQEHVNALIKGRMHNYRGKRIEYVGTWLEHGEPWGFEVSAMLKN